MKVPKQIKRYCPFCKKHALMKVFISKKKNRSALKRGSKQRAKLRGENRGAGNKGRFSKPALSAWKRYNKKSSKKTDLRYKCSVCGKTVCQPEGIRTKRLELV
ncbi:MAG TPA: 50S ribosomal protein L44e [Candidatus Woesearchaeota archaeon]|nr:50S ribosomal protein L44e [Candidatus Woesearchaeota archaeon]